MNHFDYDDILTNRYLKEEILRLKTRYYEAKKEYRILKTSFITSKFSADSMAEIINDMNRLSREITSIRETLISYGYTRYSFFKAIEERYYKERNIYNLGR